MKLNYIAIKSTIVVLFALFITQADAQQQNFSYTQYMDNLTPLNPAYSLMDQSASINTLARKQLVGINGAPTTYLVNGNVPIQSINGSAGLFVLNDQFAIEHETEVNAYFAKAIQVGPGAYLGVSLNAGIRTYNADYSTLDSDDPNFRNDVKQTKPNVGFGVMYYTDWYYVGVSVPELTVTSLGTASVQNNSNFTNHYYFAAALITDLDEDIKFKPATLVSFQKDVTPVMNISGTFYLKEILGIGVNYNTNNQAAGILTINAGGFHIGYSYQFNTASQDLGGYNSATHEVTLGYRFGKGSGKVKLL